MTPGRGFDAEGRGCGGVPHRPLDGDDVASGRDQAAREVVPQLVKLEGHAGVVAGGAPAVVDEVVVPGLAVFVE